MFGVLLTLHFLLIIKCKLYFGIKLNGYGFLENLCAWIFNKKVSHINNCLSYFGADTSVNCFKNLL